MQRVLIPPSLSPGLLDDYPAAPQIHVFGGETMGTTWSVKIVAPSALATPQLKTVLQRRLDRVVAQMSTWTAESDLSRFNAAPANVWQVLPQELTSVLECALKLAKDTDGAFDPAAGALTNLWGFGPAPRRSEPPGVDEIREAVATSGWRHIELDARTRRARHHGIATLDLSGIAKGFGVDELANELDQHGIAHYLAEVGGELRGRGCKPGGTPWWVAIEWPAANAQGLLETSVALHDIAIATSGDYRRYFENGGRRYSHTLDPRTGYPVDNALASVTVLHSSCMHADALATALTVLGPEEGMQYASRHNIAAVFMLRTDAGFEERLTPALAAYLN